MRNRFCSLTISMAILALLVPLALAQKPSPAGGGFVSFVDGGFAVALDDDAFDEELDSFMIEAWIYVTDHPERPFENQIIAAKPGSYELALTRGDGVCPTGTHMYFKLVAGGGRDVGSVSAACRMPKAGEEFLILDRWYHIGIGFSGSPSTWVLLYDGTASFIKGPFFFDNRTIFDSDSSLYVGGIEDDRDGNFPGFIDEVRISDVLRYIDIPDLPNLWQAGRIINLPKVRQADDRITIEYDPPGRFENDEHTRGLWHFDDGEGETEFRDSSGNNNTLIGKKGAAIVGAYAVESSSKLLITWGKIKSKY